MAFASVVDLQAQWRPLTGKERVRAEALLALADGLIRRHVTIGGPADPLWPVAEQVSIELVLDALNNGPRLAGPTVQTATLDGASYTASVPDDDGERSWVLELTAGMLGLFGVSANEPAYYFGDCPQ